MDNGHSTKYKRMVKYSFSRIRWIPQIVTLSLFLSIVIPYVISVTRKKIISFLPYVSHAAAFPPQSAIHSIFMIIAAFFGLITFAFRFVSVEHRRHALEAKKIPRINRMAFVVGLVASFSLVLASHTPVGFITHHKFDWLHTVIIPHFFGLALLVTSFTIYILMQSYLTYAQRRRSGALNVSVHATLALAVVITNWTTCLPFYAAMRQMMTKVINPDTEEITLEQQEYSFYYIISSLSGWIFLLFILLFVLSFCRDFRRMKVSVILSPKLVQLDTVQPAPHEFTPPPTSHQKQRQIEEITKM